MDNLGGGDDGFYRKIGLVHVLDNPLGHQLRGPASLFYVNRLQNAVRPVDRLVKRRDIDALYLGRFL